VGQYLILDITSHGMGAAVYERRLSGIRQINAFFLAEADIPDSQDTGSRIQTAFNAIAAGIDLSSCTEAGVLISSRKVSFRNISLPFTSRHKIAQVLPFELAPYLPGDEYVSDFLRQDIRFVKDRQLLLTASTSRDLITDITACLHSHKIRTRIITPGAHARAAAHMETPDHPPDQVVVHLDRADITLTLIAGSSPVMVRTLTATETIGDVIAENVFRMVTGFRHLSGLDTRFHVFLALTSDSPDPSPVKEALRRMTAAHPIFDNNDIPVIEPDTRKLFDLLFQKTGLLFNFLKSIHGPETFFGKFKTELFTTAVIGAMVVILAMVSFHLDISALEKQIDLARLTSAGLYKQTFPGDEIRPELSPLLLMQSRMKQKLEQRGGTPRLLDLDRTPDIAAIDVLHELSARIPAGMNARLSRLMFSNDRLTLFGTSDGFNTVDRLKNLLEQSPLFKTVTINTADAGKTDNQVIFQFSVDM